MVEGAVEPKWMCVRFYAREPTALDHKKIKKNSQINKHTHIRREEEEDEETEKVARGDRKGSGTGGDARPVLRPEIDRPRNRK